jgi:nicotinate-nucleotide adenylyltransferase
LVSTHGTCLYFRRITFLDISASAIRAAVGAEKSIRYLTPDAVIHYIDAQRLYRSTPPAITV